MRPHHAAPSPYSARSPSAARSPGGDTAGVVVGRCRRRRRRGDGGHRRLPQRAHLRERRAAPVRVIGLVRLGFRARVRFRLRARARVRVRV